MKRARRLIVPLAALLAASCGGGAQDSTASEPDHSEHGHSEHGQAEHGHGHGHHAGGHRHASPAELRPLMNDLRGWLTDLKTALDEGELANAGTRARAIATACDDAELERLDPELFGPRFLEIDRELHGAAASLADLAEAGELEPARAGYRPITDACVSCHAQAPTASAVDLGSLLADDDG